MYGYFERLLLCMVILSDSSMYGYFERLLVCMVSLSVYFYVWLV